MIETILALIGGFKGLILGGIGLLGTMFALFWRGRARHEKELRQDYERANKIYIAKDEAHKADVAGDAAVSQKMDELREEVDNAGSPEKAAGKVSNTINEYFSGKQ